MTELGSTLCVALLAALGRLMLLQFDHHSVGLSLLLSLSGSEYEGLACCLATPILICACGEHPGSLSAFVDCFCWMTYACACLGDFNTTLCVAQLAKQMHLGLSCLLGAGCQVVAQSIQGIIRGAAGLSGGCSCVVSSCVCSLQLYHQIALLLCRLLLQLPASSPSQDVLGCQLAGHCPVA